MPKVKFYKRNSKADSMLTYVIIAAKSERNKWVLVRHRDRITWEFPAGHIEAGEDPLDAAKRELNEETGSKCFTISAIADYAVKFEGEKKYGRLYVAKLEKFKTNPDFEIEEARAFDEMPIGELTYPEVHLALTEFVTNYFGLKR